MAAEPSNSRALRPAVEGDVRIAFDGQVAKDHARQHNGNVINSNMLETIRLSLIRVLMVPRLFIPIYSPQEVVR